MVATAMDPLVPTKEPKEPITVTPTEIIYHRRVRVLEHAAKTSVAEASRVFGVSRTTIQRWRNLAGAYGLDALIPKTRRSPAMPNATPTWVVDGDFDPGYHLRRMKVPAPGTWSELLEAAQQIGMTPFDRARSPWEAVVFEGLADGRAAYLLKLHHSTSDGMGVFSCSPCSTRARGSTTRTSRSDPSPSPSTPARSGCSSSRRCETCALCPGSRAAAPACCAVSRARNARRARRGVTRGPCGACSPIPTRPARRC